MPSSWRTSRYTELVQRLERLDQDTFSVEEIGTLEDYLIFLVRTKPAKGKTEVLLTAGIHGDEPAGPEAVMAAMESGFLKKWAGKFNFTIIPCINPTGYDLGTRENENGVDINRSFDNAKVYESSSVKKFLTGKRFDLFIEFHEDWEYDGYYLYELAKDGKKFGKKIIEKLKKGKFPIHNGVADGRDTVNGIVETGKSMPPPEIAAKVMALYVSARHADHIITSETPSKLNIESRIKMHLTVLETALEEQSK
jgi:hypothetical protein